MQSQLIATPSLKSRKIRASHILYGTSKWISNPDLVFLLTKDDNDPIQSTQAFLIEPKNSRKIVL